MNRRSIVAGGLAAAALAWSGAVSAGAAFAQLIDQDVPVQVYRSRGEFAKKLHGAVMPSGRGWKPAADQEKRIQVMVPSRWKVDNFPDGDVLIRATPPGHEENPRAMLMVVLTAPRDDDPLEIDEPAAAAYADEVARDPSLKRLKYQSTDGGFVVARGMKFALAGGTMLGDRQEPVRQQQLLYVAVDRMVSVQFTATEKEFPKHVEDVAKVFASYRNLTPPRLD